VEHYEVRHPTFLALRRSDHDPETSDNKPLDRFIAVVDWILNHARNAYFVSDRGAWIGPAAASRRAWRTTAQFAAHVQTPAAGLRNLSAISSGSDAV
jgi:hypothetical protein